MKTYSKQILIIIFTILSLYLISNLVISVLVGGILAYMLKPIFDKLPFKSKTLRASLITFFVLSVLILPGFLVIQQIVYESISVVSSSSEYFSGNFVFDCQNDLCKNFESMIGSNLATKFQDIVNSLAGYIFEAGKSFLVGLPRFVISIFVSFMSMFYFLIDSDKVVKIISKVMSLPPKKFNSFLERFDDVMAGVVKGYFLVALIQGTLGGIGFLIFGVPQPIFWGIVMAIFALIPVLGTGIVWIPGTIYLFTKGLRLGENIYTVKAISLFIYSFIFVSSLDNVIRPKIVGDRARIHPGVILLGLLGGIFMLGPIGVIIGPLILSVTTLLYDVYFN